MSVLTDGTLQVTVVDGTTFTGLYAPDGSLNVIEALGDAFVGQYHPCGALYVTLTSGQPTSVYAPDGSLLVGDEAPYAFGVLQGRKP